MGSQRQKDQHIHTPKLNDGHKVTSSWRCSIICKTNSYLWPSEFFRGRKIRFHSSYHRYEIIKQIGQACQEYYIWFLFYSQIIYISKIKKNYFSYLYFMCIMMLLRWMLGNLNLTTYMCRVSRWRTMAFRWRWWIMQYLWQGSSSSYQRTEGWNITLMIIRGASGCRLVLVWVGGWVGGVVVFFQKYNFFKTPTISPKKKYTCFWLKKSHHTFHPNTLNMH